MMKEKRCGMMRQTMVVVDDAETLAGMVVVQVEVMVAHGGGG